MKKRNATFVVEVGTICNNNCIFCMEERSYPEKTYSFEDFVKARKLFNRVNFSRKEPTLNPKLLEYIKMARSAGFERIELTTNGRMLSVKPFAEKLVDAGVNVFQVSFHALDRQLYEALTRTPGSFDQALRGIGNLVEIRKRRDIRIEILMTVTKLNVKEIPKMVDFCHSIKADQLTLNIFDPIGKAEKFASALLPKYSEVVKYIEMSNIRERKNLTVNFSLPFCVVPPELREFCSIYEVLMDANGRPIQDIRRGKIFLKKCEKCKLKNFCDGVWKKYVEIYGEEEFQPIE